MPGIVLGSAYSIKTKSNGANKNIYPLRESLRNLPQITQLLGDSSGTETKQSDFWPTLFTTKLWPHPHLLH